MSFFDKKTSPTLHNVLSGIRAARDRGMYGSPADACMFTYMAEHVRLDDIRRLFFKHDDASLSAFDEYMQDRVLSSFLKEEAIAGTNDRDYALKGFCAVQEAQGEAVTKKAAADADDRGYTLKGLCAVQEGDVVIDCGAYHGAASEFFSQETGESGRVWAFEPAPDNFAELKQNVRRFRLHNVMIDKRGLSDNPSGEMFAAKAGSDWDAAYFEDKTGERVRVRTTTLDAFVKERNLETVDFIHIDTSGSEADVLQSASDLIRRLRPKLSVVASNNPLDVVDLPQIIERIEPGYTFYLRKRGKGLQLYCVPPKGHARPRLRPISNTPVSDELELLTYAGIIGGALASALPTPKTAAKVQTLEKKIGNGKNGRNFENGESFENGTYSKNGENGGSFENSKYGENSGNCENSKYGENSGYRENDTYGENGGNYENGKYGENSESCENDTYGENGGNYENGRYPENEFSPPRSQDTPFVSVIIPAYKAEHTLGRTLNSIRSQMTRIPHEVIVVDDCSPDKTAAAVQAIMKSDPQLGLLRLAENAGVGSARNAGMDVARGEWLWFFDADDIIPGGAFKDFNERSVCGSNDCIVFSHTTKLTKNSPIGGDVNQSVYDGKPAVVFSPEAYPDILTISPAVWYKWFRKEFLTANNIRYPAYAPGEEVYFSTIALAAAKSVRVEERCIYTYQFYNSQITRGFVKCEQIFKTVRDVDAALTLMDKPELFTAWNVSKLNWLLRILGKADKTVYPVFRDFFDACLKSLDSAETMKLAAHPHLDDKVRERLAERRGVDPVLFRKTAEAFVRATTKRNRKEKKSS